MTTPDAMARIASLERQVAGMQKTASRELPEISSVQRAEIRPGDRIIVTVPGRLSMADAEQVRYFVRRALRLGGDVPVLVLDDGMTLSVTAPGPPPVVHWLTGKVTTACGSGGTGQSALVNTGLNSTIRADVTCGACKQTTAWRTT